MSHQPAPRRLGALATVLLTVAVTIGVVATPASAAVRDPVLFVHGFSGWGSQWNELMGDFRNSGYAANELSAWSYDSTQSNVTIAQQLSGQVNALLSRTGAAKVDIVAHSMGSLNSRYYLKFLGGTAKVDDWVSLGGPNHGTNIAGLCSLVLTSCREMQVGSAFLNNLNSGDETPGAVRYGAFWSWCDEIINPDSSVPLSGAENVNVGCIEHIYLMYSDSVSQRVRSFVA